MEGDFIIRLFHPEHYSHARGRFKSTAISTSRDGLSIIDEACAIRCSGSICEHCGAHYESRVSGDPAVFARIELREFEGAEFERDESEGDQCHFLTNGLPRRFDSRFVKSLNIEDLRICDANGERELTYADICAQNPP